MDNVQIIFSQIKILLEEIRVLIYSEIGVSYDDLDKAIQILSQKNYNQISSINKKLSSLSIMLYNRSLSNSDSIFKKLDEIDELLTHIK